MEKNNLTRASIASSMMRELGIPEDHIRRFNKTGEVLTFSRLRGGYCWRDNQYDRNVIDVMKKYGRTVYLILDECEFSRPTEESPRKYLYVSVGDANIAQQNLIEGKPLLNKILVPVKGSDGRYEAKAYVIGVEFRQSMPIRIETQEGGIAVAN